MLSPAYWAYYQDSRNRKELPDAQVSGKSEFHPCGDRMQLFIQFDGDRIKKIHFQANACGAVVAAAALATELLTGKSVAEARNLNSFQLDEQLGGLPLNKRHAYLMFLECLHEALNSYEIEVNQHA